MIKRLYEILYSFLYKEFFLNTYYITLAKLNIKNVFIMFLSILGCIILGLIIGKISYEHINKKNISGKIFFKVSSLMFFVCLSFFVNLIINYGEIYPGMPMIEPLHTTLGGISFEFGGGGFNRVYREEWLRGIIEIIIYIPLGVGLYNLIQKKSAIKTIVICAVISIVTELLCNTMNVSAFYYVTLCNNLIGVFIGIGFVIFLKRIREKEKKNNIKCMLAQLPLILVFLVYAISYAVYFRYDFGSIYPQYYKAIECDKINVSINDNVDLSGYEWSPNGDMSFSVDELRKYAEYYFSMYEKEIDDEKTVIDRHEQYDIIKWTDKEETLIFEADKGGFIFHILSESDNNNNGAASVSPVETQNVLRDYGINIDLNKKQKSESNSYLHSFTYWNQFSDGIYSHDNVDVMFDDEGKVSFVRCLRYFYTDIKVIHEDAYNNVYYVGNPEEYYEIVSPQQAYEKLCAGEGYAEGLVEAADKRVLDIHVIDYHIETQRDDLNCLQYVYCFDVEPIEVEGQAPITKIYVPAMKLNY